MLFNLMYVFIFLFKFVQVSDRLLGNSCSLVLRYVFEYMYHIVDLVFPTSVFGVDISF